MCPLCCLCVNVSVVFVRISVTVQYCVSVCTGCWCGKLFLLPQSIFTQEEKAKLFYIWLNVSSGPVCEHHCCVSKPVLAQLFCHSLWQIRFKYSPLFLSHTQTGTKAWQKQTDPRDECCMLRGVTFGQHLISSHLSSTLPYLFTSLHPASCFFYI